MSSYFNLDDYRSRFTQTKMLLNIFLIIIAIRPCALMPIVQNLDSFVIHSDNIGEIGAHHDNIAHSLEPNHYLQPYLSYFNSIPDTYDSHLQYDHSSSNPFQERETESSSYDYTLFLDGVPSLDSESHYSDLDSDHQALQEYLEYHRKLSTYSSPMTEKGIVESSKHTNKELNIREEIPKCGVMDSWHSNTSPHGEIMYADANEPTNTPRINLQSQLHSSTTSLRDGEFTNDDMCIGSPLTDESWDKHILSPSKKGNWRIDQDTIYDEFILHHHQNYHFDPLNLESSHEHMRQLDQGLLGIEGDMMHGNANVPTTTGRKNLKLQINPPTMSFSNRKEVTQPSPVVDSFHRNTSPHGEKMQSNAFVPTNAARRNLKLQITPSIMPFSNSGAGTQTSPVMDSYHSNTSPHGEIMYGNVNMPTSAPGGNVVPQIHSSNTSLRNGRFTNDDMCIGSPLTGRKRTQPKWEQNILSPSKKGNLRVVQDTHTDDEYSAPILHQHQNKKSHSLNSESSHNQIGKLDEGFFGIEFVPSILKMETEHHILHQLPDPKGYKSWKVGSMIYAYAHHGSLIIKKNPHDFDHMNELWKFGSLYLLKLQNERFPHLDLGSKPPLMWRLEHVLFPMLVHKADWTFDLFGKIQKRGALKNKSLVYQSVCAFFTKWLTKLMDEYPFNWNNILHSGAVYETLTKGYGGSPKDLSNITLHLEFGASREFWVSLSWELYERWLEDNDIELYSAIINPRTHQIPRVFKVPYGLDVRKSMILEEGPYVKEEFERYYGAPDFQHYKRNLGQQFKFITDIVNSVGDN